ncbi:MAG: tRNA lysidine(34) synthetase TilS [Ruminococcaceae bacterium]|nr:tRNA lysidine(34) synthetase TilS [Oscillospiraceae bacterium]
MNKKKFLESLTNKCNVEITPDLKIIAGVSGGADSVCMLLLLNEIFNPDSIICCHFNHKIRGVYAERDAKFTENLAKKLGVKFELAEADVPLYAKENGLGLEEAARKLRYNFFEKIKTKYSNSLIAVAHNKNDKTETILHNISRGTSIDGLKGIEYRRGDIIRPLLDFSKTEIISICENYGVKPIFDETNDDVKYKRNMIRNNVIPYLKDTFGEDFENHILALSESASLDSEFLQRVTKESYERICTAQYKPFFKITLNYFEFLKLDAAIQNRLIRFILSQVRDIDKKLIFPEYTGIYSDMILRVRASTETLSPGKYIEVGLGVLCVKTSEDIYFAHKSVICPTGKITSSIEITQNVIEKGSNFKPLKNEMVEYFDADGLSELYGIDFSEKIKLVRNDNFDCEFHPFGMKGRKKLRKFLIDSKIGTFERAFTELVTIGENILWIPGIRRSNIAPIDKNTTRVIIIKYIP